MVSVPQPNRPVACTLSPTKRVQDLYAGRTIESHVIDTVWPEGNGFVDFDGDGRRDYCRVIGNNREFHVCTLSNGRKGFGKEIWDAVSKAND